MIFETERLIVRKLNLEDLKPFHQLESNPKILKYATGEVKTLSENKKELKGLISRYNKHLNDFWIYAIERKSDQKFVGTLALVKDGIDNEIGYRFLEEFWNKGYGFEVCKAAIIYCKKIGMQKLVAYCVDVNIASAKILKKLHFKAIAHFISDDIKLPETKYVLEL